MTLNEKKEIIKKPAIFNYILQENPLAIVLTGSSLTGLIDENSDIDLLVIVENYNKQAPRFSFEFNNQKIHYYFADINLYNPALDHFNHNQKYKHFLGAAQNYFLTKEHIVWVHDKYTEDQIYSILTNDETIKFHMLSFINELRQLIFDIHKEGIKNNERLYNKMIHQLIWISHVLEGTEYDTEQLQRIKRMRWQPVLDSDFMYIERRIQYLIENYLTGE